MTNYIYDSSEPSDPSDLILTCVCPVDRAELISLAEGSDQLTLPTFADLYADSLAEEPGAAEEAFDALDANGDGLVQITEMYGFESVKFMRWFPRHEPTDE